MRFDERTEYKASNGQVFIIGQSSDLLCDISETASSYLSRNQLRGESYCIRATSYSECVAWIEKKIKKEKEEIREEEERERRAKEEERERRAKVETYFNLIKDRITELKQAFEASGRKQNYADPSEIDRLKLTLTEKKIMQQCKRPKCNGCKLGWICPKFWSE